VTPGRSDVTNEKHATALMSVSGVWDEHCRAEDKLYIRCVNDSSNEGLMWVGAA